MFQWTRLAISTLKFADAGLELFKFELFSSTIEASLKPLPLEAVYVQ